MSRSSTGPLLSKSRAGLPDAILAGVVISVITLMIVPLPTWLLDILLATNLALSVSILLVTLYVTDALQIAAFPTVLLITTLLRLGLNVASTRLILLQANAGEVIRAFGSFVVRGNYVVGAVVFLVLSIIQFLVIAKGSERVAEVAARFALDSMPGKQMAIDAELRSGTIDGNLARRRRRQLARESQFYGAMDGAMKFVKGDVIASLLITLVNIFGGLAIGVGQRNMEAVAALKRYGLLTIGDGLVTQIPALILATSAGVLVTRVASEEPDTPLGEELASQLFGTPRALRVAAVFVFGLSLVPGLPTLPFLVIAVLLFFVSRARARNLRTRSVEAESAPQVRGTNRRGPEFMPLVVPWSITVGSELAHLLLDDAEDQRGAPISLRALTLSLRERMFFELGVPLPPCRLLVDPDLSTRQVVLCLHELPEARFSLPDTMPADGQASFITDRALVLLRRRAADFITMAETQALLDQLEQVAPAPVRQVLPKPLGLGTLAEVLRRLVEEQVSIRDLKSILEALGQVAHAERDPMQLAEYVRAQLRRPLSHAISDGAGRVGVVLIEPSLEDIIRGSVSRTAAGAFLTLSPPAARDVVRSIRRAVTQAEETPGLQPVLLAAPDTRRFVRKLLETELPELRVISFAELLPEIALTPLATATLVGMDGD
jgi:type III secretion protein V